MMFTTHMTPKKTKKSQLPCLHAYPYISHNLAGLPDHPFPSCHHHHHRAPAHRRCIILKRPLSWLNLIRFPIYLSESRPYHPSLSLLPVGWREGVRSLNCQVFLFWIRAPFEKGSSVQKKPNLGKPPNHSHPVRLSALSFRSVLHFSMGIYQSVFGRSLTSHSVHMT